MAFNQGQYVTNINPYDVLFGRGSGPNDHEGNIRFRDMVSQRKAEYMATNHRQTKANIAKTIVDAVFANNGRFLKKLETAELEKLGLDSTMEVYQLVDDDAIMEKAKQALRQNREKANSGASEGMENNAREATSAAAMGVPSNNDVLQGGGNNNNNNNDLPQVFVQGNQGQFGLPDAMISGSMGGMMMGGTPVPLYSMEELPVYQEDVNGYATYTTMLDDPEDDRLFDGPSRRGSTASGTRRGSLLGGRRNEGARRDSMQMADVWRRESLGRPMESMQMSELMESFKGMSTTGELNSSSDTIGTIDGDVYRHSHMSGISNMSVVSMASTTSLFKTNSSDNIASSNSGTTTAGSYPTPNNNLNSPVWNNHSNDEDDEDDEGEDNNDDSNANDQKNQNMAPPGSVNHRGSMIPRDSWNTTQLHNLLRAPIEGSSTLLTLDSSVGAQRSNQLLDQSVDSLAFMENSSFSALRPSDLTNSDRVLPPERK